MQRNSFMFKNVFTDFVQLKNAILSFLGSFASPDWSHKRSNSLFFLVGLVIVYFFISFYYLEAMKNNLGFYSMLLIMGLVPSCVLIVLLMENQVFRVLAQPLWVRFAFAIIAYIYFVFAYSWSESMVSEAMNLDPKLFPYTVKLLVLEYFAFAVLYPIAMIGELFIVIFGVFLVIAKLLVDEEIKQKMEFMAMCAFVTIFIMFTNASVGLFHKNKLAIVRKIAVDFDFNDNTACLTKEKINRIGAIRLDDSRILEAYDNGHFNTILRISYCVK